MELGNFRVTWGRAYSMPSVLYQYARTGGLFFGNGEGIKYIPNASKFSDPASEKTTKQLVPEEISTWEVGYKGTFIKKLFVDMNYYNGLSKNFFSPSIGVGGRALSVGDQLVTHSPNFAGTVLNDTLRNANFSTIFNFGTVRVYGVDIGVSYNFNKIVSLAIRYSWIGSDIKKGNLANDANKDGLVLADERALNSAPTRGVVILNFQNLFQGKAFANIAARFVAEYGFYSGNQISTREGQAKRGLIEGPNGSPQYIKNFDWGPLGGATTVDVRGGYRVNKSTALTFGVTNLFNSNVREFAGSPFIKRLMNIELKIELQDKHSVK